MTEQRDTDTQQFKEPTDSLATKSGDSAWSNKIAGIWNKATTGLVKLVPVEQVTQTIMQWFSVSEDEVAEILATVRAELPTTEALLIGKPQAGKSSIVRGLTGVSAEIVGQGFRPHTQYTERYAYPSHDLPLLIFTDTVGLGDVKQDTQIVINELIGDLQQSHRRARVLILTVKINDFATDTLRQVTQQLRQQYPDIPCLLAVTCLHEIYPPSTADHPKYPPDYEEINRAFAAIEQAFTGLYDRSILIDFTLEEDGYNPVFYGLEALRDTLADLLPEAEARAIYQLLDDVAGQQLGNIYRDAGRRYILPFAIMAGSCGCTSAIRDYACFNFLASIDGQSAGKIVWTDADSIPSRRYCQCDRWGFFSSGDRSRVNQICTGFRQCNCCILGSCLHLGTRGRCLCLFW